MSADRKSPQVRRPAGEATTKKVARKDSATKSSEGDGAARHHVSATERESARGSDTPRTLTEFMAMALLMETEAAQRYSELADAMDTHNNREVALLFRRMAEIETRHAQRIVTEMNWREVPVMLAGLTAWTDFESPEATSSEDVHYLMQPYQALQLALAGEQRAERFFSHLARVADVASVRKAARELRDEEREHVALVEAWMSKVPRPAADWADDPDPPRYTD